MIGLQVDILILTVLRKKRSARTISQPKQDLQKYREVSISLIIYNVEVIPPEILS